MPIGFDADQDCAAVAAAAKARGAAFVLRYLKNLSRREIAALGAAGLAIVSIWETTARRSLSGSAAGKTDGLAALAAARAFGQPPGSAIAATVDFDATAAQQPAVLAYLAAFKAALGGSYKLMVYANGAVCAAALDAGIADYAWLAGGSGMRGSKAFRASGRAAIVQDVGDRRGLALGIAIDSDVAATMDFGGWSPAGGDLPAPRPAAATPPADDAEALNAAELRRLGA